MLVGLCVSLVLSVCLSLHPFPPAPSSLSLAHPPSLSCAAISPWHALAPDHIVPVHRGGGECGIDNMRSLCVLCHARVTSIQASQRREERRDERMRDETRARGASAPQTDCTVDITMIGGGGGGDMAAAAEEDFTRNL